jgi:phosphatidylserine/phosphatidylglycerophosphate/cardiolipin synthase-like enzyme
MSNEPRWFKDARRSFAAWDQKTQPLPVTGNLVWPYLDVKQYYAALAQAIRDTREKIADFVYISGWELDLETPLDPPGKTPRETLRQLLQRAVTRKVEVRVLLTGQPPSGQAGSAAEVAKLGGGAILDPFFKLFGSHHQKFVVIRNAEGIVAFCGGCDISRTRLGREVLLPGDKAKEVWQESAPWHDVQVKIKGSRSS